MHEGHRHGGPPFRPPWWPEGEPFPPHGGRAWPERRARFMRRIAAVAGLFFLLLIGASALVGALVSRALGGGRGAGVLGPSLLGLGILAVAIYAFARAVRRAAGPLGDVMEAAGRVADGD